MASTEDITEVRQNVNDTDVDNQVFSDDEISTLVDELGVPNASAALWRKKAAGYSELVDTSEGGASRKLSDLHKNALNMAKTFQDRADTAVIDASAHPRVTKIVRQ